MQFYPKQFLLSILFFFLLPNLLQAQSANEWVENVGYEQTFFKFKTNHTGLHRITTAILQENGIALNGSNFKVFHRGEEIPIYVSTNEIMGETDYIEFYGQPNDGYFDTQMYAEDLHQANPYFSLFEDEGTYFLVADEAANGLRFEASNNDLSNVPAVATSFRYNSITSAANTFHFGKPLFLDGSTSSFTADFGEGEGYCTSTISYLEVGGTVYNSKKLLLNTEGVDNSSNENAQITTRIIGKNQSSGVYFDQDFTISIDGVVYINSSASDPETDPALLISGYEVKDYTFEVPRNVLSNPITEIYYSVYDGVGSSSFPFETEISIGFATIDYPRNFDFEGKNNMKLNLEIDETKYFEITNFELGENPIIYDLTSQKRIVPVVENGVLKFKIEADETPNHEIFISSTNDVVIETVATLASRNFQNPNTAGDYILLYNKQFETGECAENQIQRYINYRASEAGGSYQVVAYEIEDLYDMFAHGIDKHSMSIKNFVAYAVDNWSVPPTMMNIVGKGVQYNLSRFFEAAENNCFIPSYGHKASDMMLTTPGNAIAPQIAVGRIPARNCEHIRIYLDKLEEYDAVQANCGRENTDWTNDVLQIAKGWYDETDSFLTILEEQSTILTPAPIGMEIVETLSNSGGKISAQPCDAYEDFFEQIYNDQQLVRPHLENGVNLINYAGHSIYQTWQYDFGTPESYDNEGKYPLILSSSAFTGKINEYSICNGEFDESMSEKWVLADNRGAIGYFGYVGLNDTRRLAEHSSIFLEHLNSNEFYGKSIGLSVQQAGITVSERIESGELQGADADAMRISTFEMTYCGDPAVKMYSINNDKVELSVLEEDIDLESNLILTDNETSFTITYEFYNGGAATSEDVTLLIEQTDSEGTIVYSETLVLESPSNGDTFEFEIPVESTYSGEYNLNITIDSENVFEEDCEANNLVSIPIYYEECASQSAAFVIENIDESLQICINEYFNIPLINNSTFANYDFGENAIFDETSNGYQVSYTSTGIKNITISVGTDDCIVTETQQIEVIEPLGIPSISCSATTEDIAFDWNEINGASSYMISINGAIPIETTDLSYFLPDLSPDTQYAIEIYAQGENICGNNGEMATLTCSTEICDIEAISTFEDMTACEAEPISFYAQPAGGIYTFLATNEIFINDEPLSLISGTYEIEYTYSEGNCSVAETIELTVNSNPTIEIIGELLICEGDTSTLSISNDSAISGVLWNNAATENEIEITESGNYSVEVSDENNCVYSTNVEVTYLSAEDCSTDIFELVNQTSIKAYPVPATEILHLDFGNNVSGEYQIEIYNIEGKLINELSKSVNSIETINIVNLTTGVYWLKATNTKGMLFTTKFVKE